MGDHKPGFGRTAGFGHDPHSVPNPATKSGGGSLLGKPSNRYRQVSDDHRKKEKEMIEKALKWAANDDKRLKLRNDIVVPYMLNKGTAFLDEWMTQSVAAKADAAAPPEEEVADWWLISLLGNLVWAADCFVPGAGIVSRIVEKEAVGMAKIGKAMYATMSLGGSFVGSGGIQRVMSRDRSGDPDGKSLIQEILNTKLKQMKDKLVANTEQWATEFVRQKEFGPEVYEYSPVKYLVLVGQSLWGGLFPSFGMEDFTAMYQSELTSINSALADFNRQFKEWRGIIQLRSEKDNSTRYGPGYDYQKYVELNEKSFPFKPKLKFKG